jgi:hypothetical protein
MDDVPEGMRQRCHVMGFGFGSELWGAALAEKRRPSFPRRFSRLDILIYKLTAKRWNKLIATVLDRHFGGFKPESMARLSSQQLHTLSAEFDPTERTAVYRRFRRGDLCRRPNE